MKRPDWLTIKVPSPETLESMKKLLEAGHLHTVCEGADCPNIGECFAQKTCTFMILGDVCSRNCRFCAVRHGQPLPIDPEEPQAIALTVQQLNLQHVVVTSVTRDDLADGGAGHFAATIKALKKAMPDVTVEVLIPDFQGKKKALQKVIAAQPEVINHNVETIPRLYASVRPQAIYERSLELLHRVWSAGILSKSGLMLGLGETTDEVLQVMEDLRAVHCDILTLGQYLSPSPAHYPVIEYISPPTFDWLKQKAYDLGFGEVEAGPLVRSSYQAARALAGIQERRKGIKIHGKSG